MAERRADTPASPWRAPVAVADIGEADRHFSLLAEPEVRARIARMAGLRDLSRLQAEFDVRPQGEGGLRVIGHVSATVGQDCVVTLDPLESEVEEDIDLLFMPQAAGGEFMDGAQEGANEPKEVNWNEPEPLIGGAVDLGALATEFLILGLDPYPRKAGAVFDPPEDAQGDAGPFAGLAGWKERDDP